MRSLWAGVSGLQAHQIAMDVEGNNIANVNTIGFKYSRVNFADLLNQTSKIATAPQGDLGGKNPMQVGLGTQVSSITKIFKQGSIQTTDKNTDIAIQGDGFFVVSADGGKTYKYTRNGDFLFDSDGNFVDSNGYVVQGWSRDKTTGKIDTTAPIANIRIAPGLTTPANPSNFIKVKANLNSGDTISSSSPIFRLDSHHNWVDKNSNGIKETPEVHGENDTGSTLFDTKEKIYEKGENFGVLFNAKGEAFSIQNNEGIWVSYADAVSSQDVTGAGAGAGTTGNAININLTLNGVNISGTYTKTSDNDENSELAKTIAALINAKTSQTGVEASTSGAKLKVRNDNKSGTEAKYKNIELTMDASDATGISDAKVTTAFLYQYASSAAVPTPANKNAARTFTTTEDLRYAMQTDARLNTNYNGDNADNADKNDGVTITVTDEGKFQISNPTGDTFNADDGDIVDGTATTPFYISNGTLNEDVEFPTGTSFPAGVFTNNTGADIVIPASVNSTGSDITISNGSSNTAFDLTGKYTLPAGTGSGVTFNDLDGDGNSNDMQILVGTNFKATNDFDLNLGITGYSDETTKVGVNSRLLDTFSALQGILPGGSGVRTTQEINAASHATSIDVFDSLGSKHTVRLEFRKTGFTSDGGSEWAMTISVPKPGDINGGQEPKNIVTGSVSFKSDGSLAAFSPSSISFSPNNGASPNQNIDIDLGTSGLFDGMTSFDAKSTTSGISQDGYPGGDLTGIRIDESGTLIGSFTNGRSFGLAKVAMASFTNNSGLENVGGNTFIQTSNSGDPVIGAASTGKRGSIQASSLEMSNVDLSRSLTQLIVIQRGFQANSKTITTSDQMLQTLLQLKQ